MKIFRKIISIFIIGSLVFTGCIKKEESITESTKEATQYSYEETVTEVDSIESEPTESIEQTDSIATEKTVDKEKEDTLHIQPSEKRSPNEEIAASTNPTEGQKEIDVGVVTEEPEGNLSGEIFD